MNSFIKIIISAFKLLNFFKLKNHKIKNNNIFFRYLNIKIINLEAN